MLSGLFFSISHFSGFSFIYFRHQTLKIYNLLGNEVFTLVDEYRNAGSYEIDFNPASSIGAGSIKNLASGIYFYQLRAGNYVETKKMMLLK